MKKDILKSFTDCDKNNLVPVLVVPLAELLEQRAVVLEVGGRQVHCEELFPRTARHFLTYCNNAQLIGLSKHFGGMCTSSEFNLGRCLIRALRCIAAKEQRMPNLRYDDTRRRNARRRRGRTRIVCSSSSPRRTGGHRQRITILPPSLSSSIRRVRRRI